MNSESFYSFQMRIITNSAQDQILKAVPSIMQESFLEESC